MKSIYILTIKPRDGKPEIKFYCTSVNTIFLKFDYDVLRVKYSTTGHYNFNHEIYENDAIKIEKAQLWLREDVLKEKKKKK